MHRRVIILGSTGSIGTQAVDVIAHLNALHGRGLNACSYEVVGLACRSNLRLLAEQARAFPHAKVAIAGDAAADARGVGIDPARLLCGDSAAQELVHTVPADLVIAAIVGSAGLRATLAAVELGRDVALANKETLVAAGALIVPAAIKSGSRLLPVDSEHAALWQCLAGRATSPGGGAAVNAILPVAPPLVCGDSVEKLILTASGGPFRTWTREAISAATPEQALKHPTWSMGAKVTVDSASLMNKGLELIEAHWLFGVGNDRLEAVIHPQSLVHGMVQCTDGGLLAHLACADMRLPIQQAISWPSAAPGPWRRIDWSCAQSLQFEPPDLDRFPALRFARAVIGASASQGTLGAILNAANEEAVSAFLRREIPFGRISSLVEDAMEQVPARTLASIDDVSAAEHAARSRVRASMGGVHTVSAR
ncbi:MAG TPA: 1-deoxy-D-xylulose-5-phosphate reductoisomerase [Phycisphaerales bacterium]|nr:1-deoxy-D-xylulose-5-phosphate reductoisomerase [Phycisphaerales bacterium]